jgi:hypothetical protein
MADSRSAVQEAQEVAQQAGQKKETNPSVLCSIDLQYHNILTALQNPSVFSSAGAVGKQFNRMLNVKFHHW